MEALKTSELTFPLQDMEIIERVINNDVSFNSNGDIDLPFSVYMRGGGSFDSEYWLQVEYSSQNIGKTIIYEYDFDTYFEDEEDLADRLTELAKDINNFESRLSLNTNI